MEPTSELDNESSRQLPFVSVVIPCFNSASTLTDCLDSLDQQSYARNSYEVIVADNGSTDGTQALVETTYSWVRLVDAPEKGSGHARNAGIRAARGQIILSTDADCVADRDWVSSLTTILIEADPSVAGVGGLIAPYSTVTSVERYPPAWVSQPVAKSGGELDYAATPNAAFRKVALDTVGAFDGTLTFDDTDLGTRLRNAGFRIQYVDRAIVKHRNPSTFRELYNHRRKYGAGNYTLAQKHSGKATSEPVGRLFRATVRRIAGDLLWKLPLAIVGKGVRGSRIWPLVDAVMALGNFAGFRKASKAQGLPTNRALPFTGAADLPPANEGTAQNRTRSH